MPRFFRIVEVDDRHLPPQGKQILDRMVQLSEAAEENEGWVDFKNLNSVIAKDIEDEVIDSVQDAASLIGYYKTKFLDRQYIEVVVVKAEPKEKVRSAKLTDEEKAANRKAKKLAKKLGKAKTVADEAFEQAAA